MFAACLLHTLKDDFLKPECKKEIDEFDEKLKARLDDSNFQIEMPEGLDLYKLPDVSLPAELDNRDESKIPSDDEYGDMLVDERPEDDDEDAIDKYICMELVRLVFMLLLMLIMLVVL